MSAKSHAIPSKASPPAPAPAPAPTQTTPTPYWHLLLRVLPFPALAFASAYALYLGTQALPEPHDHHAQHLNLYQLSTIHDIKRLAVSLRSYSDTNFYHVLTLFSGFYLFKQAFCLPGAAALNVIAGSLYGHNGTILAIALTTLGTLLCYTLSGLFTAPLIRRSFLDNRPNGALARLASRVREEQARGELAYLLLFLRLFPLMPQWLLNLSSPILGISLPMFLVTVALGLTPYNIVTTQAGAVLASIESLGDIVSPKVLGQLGVMALAALVPVIVKRWKGDLASGKPRASTGGKSKNE